VFVRRGTDEHWCIYQTVQYVRKKK
jgi:hypothetical protein